MFIPIISYWFDVFEMHKQEADHLSSQLSAAMPHVHVVSGRKRQCERLEARIYSPSWLLNPTQIYSSRLISKVSRQNPAHQQVPMKSTANWQLWSLLLYHAEANRKTVTACDDLPSFHFLKLVPGVFRKNMWNTDLYFGVQVYQVGFSGSSVSVWPYWANVFTTYDTKR